MKIFFHLDFFRKYLSIGCNRSSLLRMISLLAEFGSRWRSFVMLGLHCAAWCHCGVFSCEVWACRLSGCGQQVGLAAQQHVGSSQTRMEFCIGRRIPIHRRDQESPFIWIWHSSRRAKLTTPTCLFGMCIISIWKQSQSKRHGKRLDLPILCLAECSQRTCSRKGGFARNT